MGVFSFNGVASNRKLCNARALRGDSASYLIEKSEAVEEPAVNIDLKDAVMYLRRFTIRNIRSIEDLTIIFDRGSEPGWHVILGVNGAGKSTVVRCLAFLLMGEKEAYAARQDLDLWMRRDEDTSFVTAQLSLDEKFDKLTGTGRAPLKPIRAQVVLSRIEEGGSRIISDFGGENVNRTIWGTGTGWFSTSFGPFRRFTGGDRIYDRLFVSNKRLAPHLSALGEDVALTEALSWLITLHVQSLQDERKGEWLSAAGETRDAIIGFVNQSAFLPHGAMIEEITNDRVIIRDGNGYEIFIEQMSDGYRSALSLTLELIRQMFELYGAEVMMRLLREGEGRVQAPGIVIIDEIDAHLHPSWQRRIGQWLTQHFPKIQFIVTTHSPIACRAVAKDQQITGSVWMLPKPGSDERVKRITGVKLERLVFGDILDAYSTELFGEDITRSKAGNEKLERLAELNQAALDRDLEEDEEQERLQLRNAFPSEAGIFE